MWLLYFKQWDVLSPFSSSQVLFSTKAVSLSTSLRGRQTKKQKQKTNIFRLEVPTSCTRVRWFQSTRFAPVL